LKNAGLAIKKLLKAQEANNTKLIHAFKSLGYEAE
jgi:hypothetical protein